VELDRLVGWWWFRACLVGGLGGIMGCLGLCGFVGCFGFVFVFGGVFPLLFI